MQTLEGDTSYVHHVAFSPEGKRIMGTGEDGTVKIWDT
ncbi:MAG: hypothetical protein GY917_21370, partial [Planctomycetaceae bacterium]|nr:hypothetical protein [Planctomycetaceae bacterium]